jgi:Ragulator complex protein LAMTOR5
MKAYVLLPNESELKRKEWKRNCSKINLCTKILSKINKNRELIKMEAKLENILENMMQNDNTVGALLSDNQGLCYGSEI